MNIKIIAIIVLFYIGSIYTSLPDVINFITSLSLIDLVIMITLTLCTINTHKVVNYIYTHPVRILAWIYKIRRALSNTERFVKRVDLNEIYNDLVTLEAGIKAGCRFKEDTSHTLLQPTLQTVNDFLLEKQPKK
ncbi:MAG: hypothetical protein UZ19_OD1000156 [Parcubacteria bacterium OLB19]|nr:MAG: hypothetical protein UZ19_OD1000156 [Parcubacteria bacterium OLB19]